MRPRSAKKLYCQFELNRKTYEGHYSYDDFLYNTLIVLRNQYPFLSKDLLMARAKAQWNQKLKLAMENQQQQPFWHRLSSSISAGFKPGSRPRPLKSQSAGTKFKRNTLLFNEDDDDDEEGGPPSRIRTPRKFRKRPLLVDSDEDDDLVEIQTEKVDPSSTSSISQDIEQFSGKISKTISSSVDSSLSKTMMDIEETESSSPNETIISGLDDLLLDYGQIDDGQEKCSVLNKYIPLEDGIDEDQEIKRLNKPKFKALTTTIEMVQDSFVSETDSESIKSIDSTINNIPKISISANPFMELEWNDDENQEKDGELFE